MDKVKSQVSIEDKIREDSFSNLDQDIVPKVNLNALLERKKKEDNITKRKNLVLVSTVFIIILISCFILI